MNVFHCANFDVTIGELRDSAIERSTVMTRSRVTITTTVHHGIYPVMANAVNASDVSTLSASGSRNFPKFVTSPEFLAMTPSYQSVKAARKNTPSDSC